MYLRADAIIVSREEGVGWGEEKKKGRDWIDTVGPRVIMCYTHIRYLLDARLEVLLGQITDEITDLSQSVWQRIQVHSSMNADQKASKRIWSFHWCSDGTHSDKPTLISYNTPVWDTGTASGRRQTAVTRRRDRFG